MDPYDITNVVFSKIKGLDPENASKIMGYILIQDLPDRDMMRLAFGPETLLQSLVLKAKAHLGLSSNTFSTTPSLNPISRPNSSNSNNSQNPLPQSSPRLIPRDNVDANGVIVGSPSKMDLLYHQHEEMMRMRAAAHQQRLAAAQLMAGVSSPLSYEKSMNFLLQQQNDAQRAAALMLGEEICKFGPSRSERNDFFAMGLAEKANSASRQIYLTFPAESTFKDEDVSNYFSMFGPVHDVRIPYQQKRMFGFVTFVHSETVNLILARGNPHFICDSRVLVKPYKEKGKVPEKRQHLQQQFERGNFSPCSSPSGLDSRDPFDLHVGAKMFYNAQEMMLRRKMEEQAIELQRRKIMNLQLPDFKNDGINHHQRSQSVGASVALPTYSPTGQSLHPSYSFKQEVSEVNGDTKAAEAPSTLSAAEQEEVNSACVQEDGVGNTNGYPNPEGCHESTVEHALPDSPFASPKKSTDNYHSSIPASVEVNGSAAFDATSSSPENDASLPVTSAGDMVSKLSSS
ncbi:hypothetical protein COLO4_36467 [Corchorus olitorius]|uniref:RRM domain-containing protein n=1 Tax=Corchorus olitorius TaxID=93759 RepID=A0A1R3G8U6_9ROSI|nr:hypothetical protein COLO4_36467 [Corchorus olitorius]